MHEYEGVVDKLCDRHCAGVHHHLVRINPVTRNTRIRGRGCLSETSRDQRQRQTVWSYASEFSRAGQLTPKVKQGLR